MQPTLQHLKRLLLASTALVIVAGSAHAAPPAVNWSGCYIGGHVGAGSSGTDFFDPSFTIAPPTTPVKTHTDGILGGAQIGCDRQFMNNWLLGGAGDFSWARIDGQAVDPFFSPKGGDPSIITSTKNDWLATATARVGYVWDGLLLFGRGGAAWTHGKYQILNSPVWGGPPVFFSCLATTFCNPAGSRTGLGWVAGVGAEWAFAPSWSVAIEFDHYDFGTHSVTFTDPSGVSGPVNVKQRIEAVKISFNYRFGWTGGP